MLGPSKGVTIAHLNLVDGSHAAIFFFFGILILPS